MSSTPTTVQVDSSTKATHSSKSATILLTAKASAIAQALETVSIVPPRPLTPQSTGGYLFTVQEGSDQCTVFSRDVSRVALAQFTVQGVQGSGSFVYPAQHANAFKLLGDKELTLTATSDNDVYTVRYVGPGVSAERPSLDPRLIAPLTKELAAAVAKSEPKEYQAPHLCVALSAVKSFLPKANDARVNETQRVAVLFDGSKPEWAKGNGILFATDGALLVYFLSDGFKDRGHLAVHAQHIGTVIGFLSRTTGSIKVVSSESMMYAMDNEGGVLGWAKPAQIQQRFSYPPTHVDRYSITAPQGVLLHALSYLQAEMDTRQERVTLCISPEQGHIYFRVNDKRCQVTSFPVGVAFTPESSSEPMEIPVSVHHLREVIAGGKSQEIIMKVAVVPGPSGQDMIMVRTLDRFALDPNGKVVPEAEGTKCLVTRFLTKMD